VIGWDRGRPARDAPQARRSLTLLSQFVFALRAHLRAGRPRSQPITWVLSANAGIIPPQCDYQPSTFSFRIHSPTLSGLQVGRTYSIRATWIVQGYVVDELQWLKANRGQTKDPAQLLSG